jgi:ABC-type sugar transport system ATPase subunit
MTVFENMAFALQVRKFTKNEIEKRVTNTAKTLKIDHLLHRKPKELSGGQRQRVAIGRAIVRNPYAFLFDEPLSNLDSALRCQMRYELAKLKAQLKTTMIYVTHDQSEAMTLADKIVVMRDGAIEQVGSPLELYTSPVNIFVARFIGSSEMNILPISFVKNMGKLSIFKTQTEEQISFNLKDNIAYDDGAKYFLGIRPENIEILAEDSVFFGNKLTGTIIISENLGGECFVHVSLADGSQTVIKSRKMIAEPVGSSVRFGFTIENCYLFDGDGNTIFGVDNPLE